MNYYLLTRSLHSFRHKSINIASTSLIFISIYWSCLFQFFYRCNNIYAACILFQSYAIVSSTQPPRTSIFIPYTALIIYLSIYGGWNWYLVENLSSCHACFEFFIVGTISLPLVYIFEAIILSHIQSLQEHLYSYYTHHWSYIYQYKADWSDIWLKQYLILVSVFSLPLLEP